MKKLLFVIPFKFICFRLFIDLFSNHPTIRLDDLSFSTKFKM